MTPETIGVGILGAGLIASTHAAGFQEMPDQARVVAVCDVDEEKAGNLAGLFDARVYTDYRQLIADHDVNLIDILLPHHLHHPVALDVLHARKHLLLEKPVAMTYAESREVCRAAEAAGVCFSVAENTRFIRAYVEAGKLLQEGRLGEITQVRTFLPANERVRLSTDGFWGRKAEFGGGALLDSGPHTFYLLKWLFGEIAELVAFVSQIGRLGSEVEDNADVRGRLVNGAQFLSSFSFTAEIPHSERLEIYGTEGSLIIDQLADPPARLYTDPADFDGTRLPGVEYDPMGWHYSSIVEEVKDFVRGVWDGRPPTVDPQDCCYAVHVVEKAYESAGSGHQLVQV